MNIIIPPNIVYLLPNQSAKSPAATAPIKVPADRMEVMSDFFEAGITKAAISAAEALGPGMGKPVYALITYGMARTPPIHPDH